MLSQKANAVRLSPKQEKLARELYDSALERNMTYWKEEGVVSAQEFEARKADLWVSCCETIHQTTPYALAISRIQKMLRNHYGQAFSLIAQEIQIGTVTEQELTALVIKLQNMFTQDANQEAVKAVLMPYVERNDAHMKVRLQEAEEHTKQIRAERQAAEQAAAVAMQATTAAQQEVAKLREQIAQLLEGQSAQTPNNVAALSDPQKVLTEQFEHEKLEEKKRKAEADKAGHKKQHVDKDSDKEETFTATNKSL